MVITIDGPAGSGKSTAARKLAAKLEVPYLDTGAMYRVVTLAALMDGVDLNDDDALARLARSTDFHLDCGPTHARVTLRGHDVTEEIRSTRVTEQTRYIARCPAVREALVVKQREIGRRLGTIVTEGRDQGSVAFPDAAIKFFMDADLARRAHRRHAELQADGEEVDFTAVYDHLASRDRSDSEREVGALTVPPGAIRIDTTHLTTGQVVKLLLEHLLRAGLIDRMPPDPE